MSFNFDRVIDRRNTGSLKWNRYKDGDVIPMWVADMDFQAPLPILEALHKRVEHGIFGYAVPPDELVEIVVGRMKAKYQWKVDPSWIVWLPGLVPALNVVCRAFGDDWDEVLTFTPVYPPFLSAPQFSRKQLKAVPLRREGDLFTFDAERLEKEVSPRSRVLLLCNPHNPVGRRYSREEIKRIAEICLEHNVILCSDEIHCDLLLDEEDHIPTATLSSEICANTITLMAPSKTFNIPGLNCAFAVIPDEGLRTEFINTRQGVVPDTNALGYAGCLAAYRECEEWRIALIDYLRGNRDFVYGFVNEQIPRLSMDNVEATYLAWIDCRRLGMRNPTLFFESAGVGLSDGKHFQGRGWVRLNFGCPRSVLVEALERMKRAVTKLGNFG
ncbi:MAG: PatB family C-S lyase [Phycisphaerales bacterium]|nr:MAG: PatB family C-S lyase [Phycisphaerales bacterium]